MILSDREIEEKLDVKIEPGDPVDGTHRAAEQFVKQQTYRNFEQKSYVTEFDIERGQDFLLLKDYPVSGSVTVEQIQRASDGSVQVNYTYQANEYVVDSEQGIVELLAGSFPAGRRTVRATYTAGYSEDQISNNAGEIPLVKELMLSLIARNHQHFGKGNWAHASHTFGDMSTQFQFDLTAWERKTLSLLEREQE